MRNITDEDVETAFDWLRENAAAAAKARAERVYLEEFRKSLKSQLMQEHHNIPVSAQERDAYADPRYIKYSECASRKQYSKTRKYGSYARQRWLKSTPGARPARMRG